MEAVLREWAKLYPKEVLDFDREMRDLRKAQDRSGFSTGAGTQNGQALYGEIPATLYTMVSNAVGSPHWHQDIASRETFWSLFQVGKVRRGAGLPKHE